MDYPGIDLNKGRLLMFKGISKVIKTFVTFELQRNFKDFENLTFDFQSFQ